MSDNVIGYETQQSDFFTLNQMRKSIAWLRTKDLRKLPHKDALDRQERLYRKLMRGFVTKGKEDGTT
jgi:hypothetical protein